MEKSEQIEKLAAAMAKAQGVIENAAKTSVNPHFKNRYADLAEVINTVRPVFAEHGLSVVQFPAYDAGVVSVETVVMHESGQYISRTASCRIGKDDAQGVGSAVTYLRRYSLAAVANIAQEDDDGQAAAQPKQRQQRQEQPSQQSDNPVQRAPVEKTVQQLACSAFKITAEKSDDPEALTKEFTALPSRGLTDEQVEWCRKHFDAAMHRLMGGAE